MVSVQVFCDAIGAKRRLQLHYDGYTRIVEVHACGLTKDGNSVARVWQVSGGSVTGEPVGWKLLRVDEAHGASILSEASDAPRPGYRRTDAAMARIICRVP